MPFEITALIDLPHTHAYHRATLLAVHHAARSLALDVAVAVVRTSDRSDGPGRLGDGVIVGPGSPYEDEEAVYAVIRAARERGLPLLGT